MSIKLRKNYGISFSNYKWCLDWSIPKKEFIRESECGICLQVSPDNSDIPWNLARIFNFFCYPNGESEKYEGYISLMLQEKTTCFQYCTLNITFSLKDIDGNLRFSQSLAKYCGETFTRPLKASPKPFGLSRYLKKGTLLSSDIIGSEMISIQCDIHFYKDEALPYIHKKPYFARYPTPDKETGILLIRTTDHPLWVFLCQNSPYFRKLLVEDGVTQIGSFYREDFRALHTINSCILLRKDPDISNIGEALALYEFADMVLIPQFRQNSGDFLREHMTAKIVSVVIVMADMHSDPSLKDFAIQYALSHWEEVVATMEWDYLKLRRPDLVIEIDEYKLTKEKSLNKNIKRGEIKTVIRRNPEYLEQYQFYQ